MNLKTRLPSRVTIELTNRCNRLCKGCPRNKMDYPQGDMSWKLFMSIISQLPSSAVIVPFFRGEPTLHPHFAETMEELQRFKSVQIATNGDLLNKEIAEALRCCSFVSFSLHTFHKPFSKHKQMSPYGDIVGFLRESNGVTTQISIVETLIPKGEKQGFVDAWLQYADRVRVYVEHSRHGFGDVGEFNVGWSTNNESLPCHKPFNEMVVYWDGKVALCNHDWQNRSPLGDLNTQSVEKVWNGKPYRTVRKLNMNGQRHTYSSCKFCDYWMLSYNQKKMFGELYTN